MMRRGVNKAETKPTNEDDDQKVIIKTISSIRIYRFFFNQTVQKQTESNRIGKLWWWKEFSLYKIPHKGGCMNDLSIGRRRIDHRSVYQDEILAAFEVE